MSKIVSSVLQLLDHHVEVIQFKFFGVGVGGDATGVTTPNANFFDFGRRFFPVLDHNNIFFSQFFFVVADKMHVAVECRLSSRTKDRNFRGENTTFWKEDGAPWRVLLQRLCDAGSTATNGSALKLRKGHDDQLVGGFRDPEEVEADRFKVLADVTVTGLCGEINDLLGEKEEMAALKGLEFIGYVFLWELGEDNDTIDCYRMSGRRMSLLTLQTMSCAFLLRE
ncbi:hypothetical protein BDK51DRAFT_27845 [Blyttiomyces helicus]|uniref:Uncharacterized protein n=1 Tax=Blyttiomyces helicus TaxID=388810 RepID=A0A4P9W7H4_9FUNG|nr:hypothetical protein BDK51DRAFT_27845 [Blyttiomyces helicus]|eukprot:RKO88032.1 hypothetical protein BDK51DRAFT_27845 [Blyttiomyces helicus]